MLKCLFKFRAFDQIILWIYYNFIINLINYIYIPVKNPLKFIDSNQNFFILGNRCPTNNNS